MTEPTQRLPITLWRVRDNKAKLQCVCQVILTYFRASKRQVIFTPNQQAADYLNTLLWSYPQNSFIPHTIAEQPIQAAVVITTQNENLNDAQVLFNLTASLPKLTGPLEHVHDLLDETSPQKAELAIQRQQQYQELGHSVTVQPPAK